MEGWVARGAAKLVDRDRLRALSARSDLRGGLQTASVLGALGLTTGALILIPVANLALLGPALLVHGVLLNCLYAGQHELSHWTVFKTRWLNDAFGHVFGFATLNPFLTDRWMHFAHHQATQDPARDSELIGMKPYNVGRYLLDLTGVGFWRRRVMAIVGAALGRGLEDAWWLEADQRGVVIWEGRLYVGLWALIAGTSLALQSGAALLFWLGPLLATKAFHQLQNTGEHTEMPQVADIFQNTRTLSGPAPMRWLLWNMSYHTAHHAYPGVPFHALPRLHAEIVRNLPHPVVTLGYIEAQRAILESLNRRAPAQIGA
jgi:fatty acid desaturase